MPINKNLFLIIPLHPLLLCTLTCMLGIWLQSAGHYPMYPALGGILILLITRFIKKFNWQWIALGMLGSIIIGAQLYTRQQNYYENFYHQLTSDYYDLTGTVTHIENSNNQHCKYQITVDNAIITAVGSKTSIKTDWSLLLYGQQCKELQIGDVIQFSHLKIKEPKKSSFKQYLIKQKTLATIFLQPHDQIQLLNRPQYSLNRWLYTKKTALCNAFKTKMSAQTFSFFSSLFLGLKTQNYYQERLREQFKWWGLSHYLARSGLHLIIFITLWKFLFRFIPLAFLVKQAILMILIFIYFLLTWSSISFARAFFTFIVYCIFTLFNQQIQGLHILSLVTFITVLLNPTQIFFLDFQLSYGLTFALLWFNQAQKFITRKSI